MTPEQPEQVTLSRCQYCGSVSVNPRDGICVRCGVMQRGYRPNPKPVPSPLPEDIDAAPPK